MNFGLTGPTGNVTGTSDGNTGPNDGNMVQVMATLV